MVFIFLTSVRNVGNKNINTDTLYTTHLKTTMYETKNMEKDYKPRRDLKKGYHI